jgi:hypothetical protein
MELQFWGAARVVTGSMHLLTVNRKKILLDAGLYQGRRKVAFEINRTLPFDASEIDAVILSHAHIDHSGNLPSLVKNGFLQEVMKGWYIPARPDEATGESTAWYASFWGFCAAYLKERFGANWSLSPEQSLLLHAGNMSVPRQLLVRSPMARNKITTLPHDTSLLDTRAALPEVGQIAEKDGLRLFSVPTGLVSCRSGFF